MTETTLNDLYNDYRSYKEHVLEASRTCKEMISAIQQRIDDEKERNKKRIDYLNTVIADDNKTPTSKHIAQIELDRLLSAKYQVTEEEQSAYEDEIAEYRRIVAASRETKRHIDEEIRRIKKEVQDIKAECNEGTEGLWDAWIESAVKDFNSLKGSV